MREGYFPLYLYSLRKWEFSEQVKAFLFTYFTQFCFRYELRKIIKW